MICENCSKRSAYLKLLKGGLFYCHLCLGVSEASGRPTDGILTRQAFRIRSQSYKHEADMIPPYFYNKVNKKLDLRPDFVKLYPDKVKDYFTEEEIAKAGYPKLAEKAKADRQKEKQHKEFLRKSVKFEGKQKEAMRKVLTSDEG
ncbi:MAG: hypothetical protein QW332_05535 [Thermoproteota archaeon]